MIGAPRMTSARYLLPLLAFLLSAGRTAIADVQLKGELREFHKVTLVFDGPVASEKGGPNPFQDFALFVTFSQASEQLNVPGYFAADGNAANTGASSGNKWHAHFSPTKSGTWIWKAEFRTGPKVAIRGGGQTDQSIHGMSGTFEVAATNKGGIDNRAKGMLQYVGKNHLQWSKTGRFFLKMGADSPENFLAFKDFDGTPNNKGLLKSYNSHAKHFRSGNPTWANGKGKNIIGAVNYMADKGMNVQSFLTMNIEGDDRNVFPYVSDRKEDRRIFDVSKLAQWEIVFEHMDRMGMYLHFKMQERENDKLLDREERTLYHRELVARFGHHLALNWNIGEETTLSLGQQLDYASEMRRLDAYKHHTVIHTYPGQQEKVYRSILNAMKSRNEVIYSGFSLQSGSPMGVYRETRQWIEEGRSYGFELVIASDEQGPYTEGVKPDSSDMQHNDARKNIIWGNIMAGGAGIEAYFGYQFPESDLTLQDFNSRSRWWDQCRYAKEFFEKYVPFWEAKPIDSLTNGKWAFGVEGNLYVIYVEDSEKVDIDLTSEADDFGVAWYDPVTGGELKFGGETCLAARQRAAVVPPKKQSYGQDQVAILWRGCTRMPPTPHPNRPPKVEKTPTPPKPLTPTTAPPQPGTEKPRPSSPPTDPRIPDPKTFSALPPDNVPGTCAAYYADGMMLPDCRTYSLGRFGPSNDFEHEVRIEYGMAYYTVRTTDGWIRRARAGLYKTREEQDREVTPFKGGLDRKAAAATIVMDSMRVKSAWQCCGNTLWLAVKVKRCRLKPVRGCEVVMTKARFDLDCKSNCSLRFPEDMSTKCPVCG